MNVEEMISVLHEIFKDKNSNELESLMQEEDSLAQERRKYLDEEWEKYQAGVREALNEFKETFKDRIVF